MAQILYFTAKLLLEGVVVVCILAQDQQLVVAVVQYISLLVRVQAAKAGKDHGRVFRRRPRRRDRVDLRFDERRHETGGE